MAEKKRVSFMMILPPLIFLGVAAQFFFGMQRENPDLLPTALKGQPAPSMHLEAFPGKDPLTDEALLSAGQRGSGLKWVVLARRKVGKGEIVFCQMPLHRHLAGKHADPLAQTVMLNLLRK